MALGHVPTRQRLLQQVPVVTTRNGERFKVGGILRHRDIAKPKDQISQAIYEIQTRNRFDIGDRKMGS
jgi:hypothetical protein